MHRHLLCITLVAVLLGGCGTKGPLFVPPPPGATPPAAKLSVLPPGEEGNLSSALVCATRLPA